MHYRFNLDEWLALFPLQETNGFYYGQMITSPWYICQNGNLRRELHNEYEWGREVPVDVFIMADGEPDDRRVTKIGGLPYWPARVDWPRMPDGAPMIFLGQINFCDSKDITGELPGDILLVFADCSFFPEYMTFHWQNRGVAELVDAASVPRPPSAFNPTTEYLQRKVLETLKKAIPDGADGLPDTLPEQSNVVRPCYGHIFRTVSYPGAVVRDSGDLYCRGKEVRFEYHLPQYQATQIGAAPFFVQRSDPECITGRLLCTLNSVQPAFDVPWPWLNREEAIPLEPWDANGNYLMLGDSGCIYIYIDETGQVQGHWSCY